MDTVGISGRFVRLVQARLPDVSAGRSGSYAGDDAAWLNTSAGGAGAYNAALRNFAFNSSGAVPEPTSLAIFGIGALGMVVRHRRKRKQTT